ncbi:unnamed protein product, partial [Nesidiocoris tenuis]
MAQLNRRLLFKSFIHIPTPYYGEQSRRKLRHRCAGITERVLKTGRRQSQVILEIPNAA